MKVKLRVGPGKGEIATLRQAHDAIAELRPPRSASAAEWEAFHREASRVYAEVAWVDLNHHHEARGYWAVAERRIADYIASTGVIPEGYPEMPGW
ncbi:AMED_5909 family protein [Actinokineospora sp. NPDC004072]